VLDNDGLYGLKHGSTVLYFKSHNFIIHLQECIRNGLDETETVLNIISAFEVPRFQYNSERKKFLKVNIGNGHAEVPHLFDLPSAKASLLRDR
jgi:DNA polymerase epsilon subunit 2